MKSIHTFLVAALFLVGSSLSFTSCMIFNDAPVTLTVIDADVEEVAVGTIVYSVESTIHTVAPTFGDKTATLFGLNPHQRIAFNPSGSTVLVGTPSSSDAFIFEKLETLAFRDVLIDEFPTSDSVRSFGYLPEGVIYVLNNQELTVYNAAYDNRIPAYESGDDKLQSMALADYGNAGLIDIAYVTEENGVYTLVVTDGDYEYRFTSTGGKIHEPDWADNRRMLTFCSENGLYLWDIEGRDSPKRLTDDLNTPIYAINPEGTEIAYVRSGSDYITILNIASEALTRQGDSLDAPILDLDWTSTPQD